MIDPVRPASRRLLLACLAVLALLVGACSSDGDSSAEVVDGDEVTTTTGGTDTDTDDDADEDAGEDGDDQDDQPAEVTLDDLEALLPDASAIGPDYALDDEADDDEEDEEENPLDEACPAVGELAEEGADDERVGRAFVTDDERSVEVELNASPTAGDEEAFDARIDALNSCGTIPYSDGGFDYEITASAERSDTYGDLGAVVTGTIVIASDQLAEPTEVQIRMHVFLVGAVGVKVEVGSGLAQTGPDTLEVVPGDVALIDTLATQLEQDLVDLQG